MIWFHSFLVSAHRASPPSTRRRETRINTTTTRRTTSPNRHPQLELSAPLRATGCKVESLPLDSRQRPSESGPNKWPPHSRAKRRVDAIFTIKKHHSPLIILHQPSTSPDSLTTAFTTIPTTIKNRKKRMLELQLVSPAYVFHRGHAGRKFHSGVNLTT
jgi:hypothetical protein